MWSNYFISVFRHWKKNGTYIILNILSLSAGVGLSLMAVLNANFNLTFNHFFKEADHIYRVVAIHDGLSEEDLIGEIPKTLADRVSGQLSAIDHTTQYINGRHTFRVGERVYEETVGFVDDQFLTVFQYHSTIGSMKHSMQVNSIILSHELALKWMGTPDCIGQMVELVGSDGSIQNIKIENVLDPIPDNTSFRFSCLMSLDRLEKSDQPFETLMTDGVFLKTGPSAKSSNIEHSLNALFSNESELLASHSIASFKVIPIIDWPYQENRIKRSHFMQGLHPASVLGTFATAISILLLSCFNYVNTSISTTQKRLREMAVRKVMGARNAQLLSQWWFENYLTILVAMLLGCLLAYILTPAYNAMLELNIISIAFVPVWQLMSLFFSLWLTIGLLCGLYPAMLLSEFNALDAIRKRTKLKSNGVIAKVFIALQLAMTVYTMYCLFVFLENSQYVSKLDRGYEIGWVINIPLQHPGQFSKLYNELNNWTAINNLSGTADAIGFNSVRTQISYQEMEYDAVHVSLGHQYPETLSLRLIDGTTFGKNSWNRNEVIINEMLAEKLDHPLNSTLNLYGQPMRVIGIVEDFAHRPIMLGNKLRPMVLTAATAESYRYLSLRVADGIDMIAFDQEVEDLWYSLFPYQLYQGFMQQKVLKPLDTTTGITLTINTVSAVLSVLISMIGLYSLMSLHIQKHLKEFGIRKILGATVGQIAIMINKEMLIYFACAVVVGIVASDWVVNKVLDIIYSYHISTGMHHWGLPVIFMTIMVAITIGKLIWRAAHINPAHHLRYE